MKLSETQRPISAYADGLETAGAVAPAAALRSIAAFLSEFGTMTMAGFTQRAAKACLAPETAKSCSELTVSNVVPHLQALQAILRAGRGKAAADDIASLLKFVNQFWRESSSGTTLASMLKALKAALKPEASEPLVKTFIERLNKDVRTPAFEETLAELAASKLKREDVVGIARAVYGSIPKGTSRKAALGFIRKPHDAFISAKRGIDAMKGRSAA